LSMQPSKANGIIGVWEHGRRSAIFLRTAGVCRRDGRWNGNAIMTITAGQLEKQMALVRQCPQAHPWLMARIYSYVVAYDSGFAPNPFYGYCT